MKSTLRKLLFGLIVILFFISCEDENNEPKKIIVKLGAQANTTVNGFYSLGENKTYSLTDAAANQDTIDMFCFYEHDEINNRINDITLASPAANITGIFVGENDPSTWTVKNLTKFQLPATAITVEEFDALDQHDATIESYFDNNVTSGNKKAKQLLVGDIYAFKTQDNIYGLLKVIEVEQGTTGYVKFEIKYKM